MRTCEEFAADVTELIDGRLPLTGRMSMWVHAAMCSSCRAYRKQIELVRTVTGDLKAEDPPDESKVDELAALFDSHQEP